MSGSGTSYTLAVKDVAAESDVSVSVDKEKYAFKPASPTVTVHQEGTPVTMTAAQTDGSADAGASATTTGLALSFVPAIAGLDPGDITLTAHDTQNSGISITSFEESAGGSYALAVSGISKTGNVTVSVTKEGYSIESKPVLVYYAEEVRFDGVTANGQLDTTPTIQLMLQFSGDIVGLNAGDITLSNSNV